MIHNISLAMAVLALAIAIVNLVRGERSIRKYKRDTAALERTLPERSVAEEFDLMVAPPEDEQPHATRLLVDMEPEDFDPDDLTKGGDFAFRDHLLDREAERWGAAVPQYPDVTDLAEEVDHEREARGS